MHTKPEYNLFYAIASIRKWIHDSKGPIYKHILEHGSSGNSIVSTGNLHIDIQILGHAERDFTGL